MEIKYAMSNSRWLLLFCCFICHQAFAQFKVINIPADGFVETACGNEVCMVADSKAFIAKTYNLGDSFISVVNPREFTSRTDVQHTKDSTFYVVAYRTDTLQQTVIFRTQDAGTNWQQLFHEPHYPSVFYMHNDSFGFVSTGLGALYRTINGWQTYDITQYSISTGLTSAYFLNDSVGLIGHSNGAMRTIDSGSNWNAGGFGSSSYYMRDFGQVNDSTIIATASTNSSNWIRIFRSTDTGASGKIILDLKNRGRRISEIKCFPNGECLAVGWRPTGKGNGLIYRTIDNGETWYEIAVPTSKMLYTLEFANDSIAFIGGEDGTLIRMNRNLLPPPPDTTDSTISVFEINENSDIQVYPNPFDNQVSIRSNQLIQEIQICSVFGEVRYTYSVASGQAATLSTERLPDGLYLLKINTERATFTKKIVKSSSDQ